MAEMTNEEIRLKIAELKGWKEASELVTTLTRDGKEFSYTVKFWYKPNGKTDGSNPPFWFEDASAALELVEEMRKADIFLRIDCSNLEDDDGSYSVAAKFNLVYSDTFCRAICLAWIAWKEQK